MLETMHWYVRSRECWLIYSQYGYCLVQIGVEGLRRWEIRGGTLAVEIDYTSKGISVEDYVIKLEDEDD